MSLLKNILIAGLFFSVFVAISPAFAKTSNKNNQVIVDTLKWNGLAKKSGFETDDILTEVKIENKDRPSKNIIYPFALVFLLIFGYLNYRKKSFR